MHFYDIELKYRFNYKLNAFLCCIRSGLIVPTKNRPKLRWSCINLFKKIKGHDITFFNESSVKILLDTLQRELENPRLSYFKWNKISKTTSSNQGIKSSAHHFIFLAALQRCCYVARCAQSRLVNLCFRFDGIKHCLIRCVEARMNYVMYRQRRAWGYSI